MKKPPSRAGMGGFRFFGGTWYAYSMIARTSENFTMR